jgi:hypothetical protein
VRGRGERLESYRLDAAHLVLSVLHEALKGAGERLQPVPVAHNAVQECIGIVRTALRDINERVEQLRG